MKLSKNKIPKLLKTKHQSRKHNKNKNKKGKRNSKRNTFRKRRVTNLRQKTLKKLFKES